MRSTLIILTGFMLAALPNAAIAGGASTIGSRSSGTTTFTVEIAPVAAALAANSEGAVGLWTVADSKGGLMLSLPGEISDATEHKSSIYNGLSTVFSAQMDTNPFVELSVGESTDFNGLRRQNLSFRRTAAVAIATSPIAVTMVISGT